MAQLHLLGALKVGEVGGQLLTPHLPVSSKGERTIEGKVRDAMLKTGRKECSTKYGQKDRWGVTVCRVTVTSKGHAAQLGSPTVHFCLAYHSARTVQEHYYPWLGLMLRFSFFHIIIAWETCWATGGRRMIGWSGVCSYRLQACCCWTHRWAHGTHFCLVLEAVSENTSSYRKAHPLDS